VQLAQACVCGTKPFLRVPEPNSLIRRSLRHVSELTPANAFDAAWLCCPTFENEPNGIPWLHNGFKYCFNQKNRLKNHFFEKPA